LEREVDSLLIEERQEGEMPSGVRVNPSSLSPSGERGGMSSGGRVLGGAEIVHFLGFMAMPEAC
jgi:hypothetical protein